MKKIVVLISTLALALPMLLCGCNGPTVPQNTGSVDTSAPVSGAPADETDAPETEPSAPVLTDFNLGDAETHVTVKEWPYEEGEQVDNLYYKRTTNEASEPVYAVMQADNDQPFYLPMNSTVIYTGENDECFFERYTITYKEDGADKSMIQYQLHLIAEPATDGPDTEETDAVEPTEAPETTELPVENVETDNADAAQ